MNRNMVGPVQGNAAKVVIKLGLDFGGEGRTLCYTFICYAAFSHIVLTVRYIHVVE